MPCYEMPLLIRTLTKPELVTALKRVANVIFDNGGIIRKIENLGEKEMPCKIYYRGQTYKEASHFLFYFDVPPLKLDVIVDEYNRDIDIIRSKVFKQKEPVPSKCTLEAELLPPAYRSDVQKLIQLSEIKKLKHAKKQFSKELTYYPSKKVNIQ